MGIQSGNTYDPHNHYHSKQYEAQIVSVDKSNLTGMLHLHKDEESIEENRYSWKEKFIGCYVTVEKTHFCDELQIYRCLELGDYWSSNEIEIIRR